MTVNKNDYDLILSALENLKQEDSAAVLKYLEEVNSKRKKADEEAARQSLLDEAEHKLYRSYLDYVSLLERRDVASEFSYETFHKILTDVNSVYDRGIFPRAVDCTNKCADRAKKENDELSTAWRQIKSGKTTNEAASAPISYKHSVTRNLNKKESEDGGYTHTYSLSYIAPDGTIKHMDFDNAEAFNAAWNKAVYTKGSNLPK